MILKKKQHRFHQKKSNNWINNIDIYKIVVSNKVSVGKNGFKHFVCKDDKKIMHIASNNTCIKQRF